MSDDFTPALGRLAPTRFYDPVVALTRERRWRSSVVMYASPRPGETIVDVGCGTGTLALLLARAEPRATIVGVDPDPSVLAAAERKAAADRPGATVRWERGMGDALVSLLGTGSVDTAVSSLVLHQCPVPVKRAILASMHAVLRPGGRLVVADYGLQRTRLMRLAFRTVQLADGRADTQPNADGVLPELIAGAGFGDVREAEVVPTVTGSISLYVARRP
ncbi:methyltransferase domain-containing protein [Dactylosporangium sp. NPDC006015]|uniref:class I SAM-dependent methyltransferase n=1 Tax=Dactylosporangium sp. NPDC006015 TaxID=3154576 RepID=UPI0033BE83B3